MTEALTVRGLTKDYGSFRAVNGISFDVPMGAVVGLLGPNGAGKSTTIQILVGITEGTSGEITYFGENFRKRKGWCLSQINFTSAYNSLQYRITVRENLQIFAGLYAVENPKHRVEDMLEQFDLRDLANQSFSTLSAGQKTRVNLAKALINDPKLILMDEPTASLDPDVRDKMLTLIEDTRKSRGLSVLYTSHNMDEVARICDEVIFLEGGNIVRQDTPTNLVKSLRQTELHFRFEGSKYTVAAHLESQELAFRTPTDESFTLICPEPRVASLLGELAALPDIAIVDVEVHKPDLEDVFLDIARNRPEGG